MLLHWPVLQYISNIFRYPLKNGKAVQPAQVQSKSEKGCDYNNKEE